MVMGKPRDLLTLLDEHFALTRRGFIKSVAAAGVAANMFACSKKESGGGDGDTYWRYGTTAHNCGGRCIIRAEVKGSGDNRRIVRFLTDETLLAYDGEPTNGPEAAAIPAEATFNSTQARACSRCRGYKGRLYHPGRLKYPLKQTKERGDATGFVRVSWQEAISDITARLKAVQNKYGTTAFHPIYACGNIASQFEGGGYTGVFAAVGGISPALRLLGGANAYTSDYSFHQGSYMGAYGTAYSGMINMAPTPQDLAANNKYMVMWGSNIPTTHNPKAYSWVKSMEEMKKRGGKVIFIGPEFSEVGISVADEWIQTRPYTDVALAMGMLYYMLDKTIDSSGNVQTGALDLDYLDTMVYGLFDSPEYYIKIRTDESDPDAATALGTITGTKPGDDKLPYYNHVAAVSGCSLARYILGSADTRLNNLAYSSASNYVAKQYNTISSGLKRSNATYTAPKNNKGADLTKETGTSFEYKNTASSPYLYKHDLGDAKTPAWASKITGIPEQRIKDLAQMYLDCGINDTPVYNEWAGGQLKQADGCVTLFALQCLLIVSKNWGLSGTGIANNTIGVSKTTDPNQITARQLTPPGWSQVPAMAPQPQPSVTQWHTAIKFAFTEQLKANGYIDSSDNVSNIPDFKSTASTIGSHKVYFDDGGVKALIDWNAVPGGGVEEFSTTGGAKYFKWKNWTDSDATLPTGDNPQSSATISGFRFVFNSAGNIPVNQHANSIDSMNMFKALPTYGYGAHAVNDMADAFYLVTLDNFMSPSARYSDYVLPGKTTWEQEDFVTIENSGTLYVDSVIPGPGESMGSFDFGREWIKAYAGEAAATQFSGIDANSTFKDYVQKVFNEKIRTDPASPYRNKNWNEFLEKPISHAAPNLSVPTTIRRNATRQAMDEYLAAKDFSKPFFANIMTVDSTAASGVYGFNGGDFAKPDECPQQSKRFHVFSGSLVWRYEHLFDKWHGYLPVSKQGQSNKDKDTSAPGPMVWPVPIYFAYQDYYWESYGLGGSSAITTANPKYLLMTTTHDRFRAHSSQAENPYLRELTHRVIGGGLYSGNDWKRYAVSSDPDTDMNLFPPVNELIGPDGLPVSAPSMKRASYADIWINEDDAKAGTLFGGTPLKDGDLVKVENPIGAVYCTVRTTSRCIPGFVGLHQGCWFDPREINGKTVDVGGNCNTLMASRPSRIDHGNAQQSALVTITKVQG